MRASSQEGDEDQRTASAQEDCQCDIAGISAGGTPGRGNYAAAKGGIVGLSRVVSSEWARFCINVNVVAPGFIDTRMTQAIPGELREKMIKEIPMGRPGTPEDIANAVLFLCSAMSDYITGQILCVNGGVYKL